MGRAGSFDSGEGGKGITGTGLAWVLNYHPHDVPVSVAARILKPSSNRLPASVKFFAAVELLEIVKKPGVAARLTTVLKQHWQKKIFAKKDIRAEHRGINLCRGINLLIENRKCASIKRC